MAGHKATFRNGTVAVAVLAAAVWAAPISRPRPKLPNQWQSLANIQQIDITIEDTPPLLHEAGVTNATIRKGFSQALKEAGFEIKTGKDVPRLVLMVGVVTEPKVPDAVAYRLYARLEQSVHIKRLDVGMALPTYTDIVVGLEPKAALRRAVVKDLDPLIKNFINRVCLASDRKQ